MRTALWVFLLLFSTVFAVAESEWDFNGERVPSDDDVSLDLNVYMAMECGEQLDVLYQSYVKKHPDFARFSDQPEMHEKWLFSMLSQHFRRGQEFLSHCIYGKFFEEFQAFRTREINRPHRAFCGVAGKTKSHIEAMHVRRLEILAELATKGAMRAASNLIILTDSIPVYRLSADIRFFIVEVMKREIPEIVGKFKGTKYDYVIPDHQTGLSKERMAEIRGAVMRHDPSVVLNEWTTCVKLDL